jgi:hypothetical protein
VNKGRIPGWMEKMMTKIPRDCYLLLTFKLEFNNEDGKRRVLEGGPRRHKGDALIVVHYYGLTRLSEVRIDSIALWARLCDLPSVMMKETFARQLGGGGQIGRLIKMDARYLGYMWI